MVKKYLILDSTEKYEEVFLELCLKSKHIIAEKNYFMKKIMLELGLILTDDDLPLNKQLKFPTLTIIIRCVLQKGEKLYPQIYLDECLYKIV